MLGRTTKEIKNWNQDFMLNFLEPVPNAHNVVLYAKPNE